MPWNTGQRDAALAGRLAARQPNRERLRDPLRVLLESLEERPDLVQEDRLRRKLRFELRVTSKHGAILRPEPRFVSPESYADPGSQNGYHRCTRGSERDNLALVRNVEGSERESETCDPGRRPRPR